jgi:hypothetical protein
MTDCRVSPASRPLWPAVACLLGPRSRHASAQSRGRICSCSRLPGRRARWPRPGTRAAPGALGLQSSSAHLPRWVRGRLALRATQRLASCRPNVRPDAKRRRPHLRRGHFPRTFAALLSCRPLRCEPEGRQFDSRCSASLNAPSRATGLSERRPASDGATAPAERGVTHAARCTRPSHSHDIRGLCTRGPHIKIASNMHIGR